MALAGSNVMHPIGALVVGGVALLPQLVGTVGGVSIALHPGLSDY